MEPRRRGDDESADRSRVEGVLATREGAIRAPMILAPAAPTRSLPVGAADAVLTGRE
jgi:hypothetical protein